MSRANKKGRSTGSGRFLALHHFLLNSAAWRALTPYDRAVYLAVAQRYDGTNNGNIVCSVRAAADDAGINKDTAAKCLERLTIVGFLERTQEGGFSTKVNHAATWRLTQHRCDRTGRPGSRAFMKWRPETAERGPTTSDRASHPAGQYQSINDKCVPSRGTERAA